jgi:hypothetical protein
VPNLIVDKAVVWIPLSVYTVHTSVHAHCAHKRARTLCAQACTHTVHLVCKLCT